MIQTFTVPGFPIGKQRAKVALRGKHPHAYTPKKTVEYEKHIRQCAIDAGIKMMERVRVDLLIVIPVRWKRYKTKPDEMIEPLARPDIDNVAKSFLDAMQGVAFENDKNVLSLKVDLRFNEMKAAKVFVSIESCEWQDHLAIHYS